MLPSTPEYYCFLVLVFFAFWLLRRFRLACMVLVCAANLFFYAKWGLIYLLLIPGAATSDFFIGRALARIQSPPTRRLLISCSLLINIGLIASGRTGGLALPLSLSFYAFQALTYTIDIYRKDAQPSPSYLQYLASVSFFPTALAGPITRVSSLIPQWNWKGVALTGEEGSRALFLIGLGLAKKFLIADYLGNNLVNRVFDLPTLYSGGDVLVAVYAYAFQLYYDFSGYSDIAIGCAWILGIRLPENFNWPYAARNLQEFWTRWHISLSLWIRDYVYIPMGGGRRGWPRRILNALIAFGLCGLWHGPARHFVVWGLYHGCGLGLCASYARIPDFGSSAVQFLRRASILGWALTQLFAWLGWLLFFYPTHEAWHMARQLFGA